MQDIQIGNAITSLQDTAIDSLMSVGDFDQMMKLQVSFQSVFIPLLTYIVANGQEEHIAKVMNFGYLFSELSYFKLGEMYSSGSHSEVLPAVRIQDEESYKRIKERLHGQFSQYFSVALVQLSKLLYNVILLDGIKKLEVFNFLIAASDIANTLATAPFLVKLFMDPDALNEILAEVHERRKIIETHDGSWDRSFSGLRNYPAYFVEDDDNLYLTVEKFPIGSKLCYWEAVRGLELGLYILSGDSKHINASKEAQKMIEDCLESVSQSTSDNLYRNFSKISNLSHEHLFKGFDSIRVLSSHQFLLEHSDKFFKKRYIEPLIRLGFYLKSDEIALPKLIYNFYNNAAQTIIQGRLRTRGIDSQLYSFEKSINSTLFQLEREVSLTKLTAITFNVVSKNARLFFEKAKPIKNSFQVLFIYSIFLAVESNNALYNNGYKKLLTIALQVFVKQFADNLEFDKKISDYLKKERALTQPKGTDLQTYITENMVIFKNELKDFEKTFGIKELRQLNDYVNEIIIDQGLTREEKVERLENLLLEKTKSRKKAKK